MNESEIRAAISALKLTADDGRRLALAAELVAQVFPLREPIPAFVDREPAEPAALTPVERAVLEFLAGHLDRPGGPTLVWLRLLSAAMRCHGLPESTAGLRGYLGLGRRAAMEIVFRVSGESIPLFRACKRVHLGSLAAADLYAAIALHPSTQDHVEVCATFNPYQYEIAKTGRHCAPDELDALWGAPLVAATIARPAEALPLLAARAEAACLALAGGRPAGIGHRVLEALVVLRAPLDPLLDPLVASFCKGIMRAALRAPRQILAALPLDRRARVVLGLSSDLPRNLSPRDSGHAWDFADLAPTNAVAEHLMAGVHRLGPVALAEPIALDVARVLAAVGRPGAFPVRRGE